MRFALATAFALLMTGFVTPPIASSREPVAPGLEAVKSEPVQIGQQVKFRSKILSDEVSMNIHLPDSFEVSSPDHTYPVIFINGSHGYQFFAAMVGIIKHLGDRERIPESIVVSLNDMGDVPEIHTHGMWGREKIGGSGDPRASLRHLQEEVIPYLERNYRANHYRIIVGVSGSCLFPIYTFTHAPGLFDSHILVAAADMVGMGYDSDSTFIDTFEKVLSETPTRKAKLYVGVADSDVEKRPDYQVNMENLKARLGGLKQLDLKVEVVPDADHYAVLLEAMLSALGQNFPPKLWSSRYRDLVAQPGDALENIDRYYRQLSQEYGFTILPRAERWNNVNSLAFMIRHLIREDRAKEAITIAQRRIEYRPQVAGSYAGLADAYEADGRLAAAVKAQKKAVKLAKASDDSYDLALQEERLNSLMEAAK